jgi:hypothetical protein
MRYEVRRLDENPANTYTYQTWVLVSIFLRKDAAEDYVKRAESPTQKLIVVAAGR